MRIVDREALPPLLRGLGTLLILLASALALYMERPGEGPRAAAITQATRSTASPGTAAGQGGIAAPSRERSPPQAVDDHELADRVLENPAFQLLGLLGTLVIAASFFVESWQKRRHPDAARPEPAE